MSENLRLRASLGSVMVDVPVCWDAATCESVRRKYQATGGVVDLIRMVREGSNHGTAKENRWFARTALQLLQDKHAARLAPDLVLEVRSYIRSRAPSARSVPVNPQGPGASRALPSITEARAGDAVATAAALHVLEQRAKRRPSARRSVISSDQAFGELARRADELEDRERELEERRKRYGVELEEQTRKHASALEQRAAELDKRESELEERGKKLAGELEQRAAELDKREGGKKGGSK